MDPKLSLVTFEWWGPCREYFIYGCLFTVLAETVFIGGLAIYLWRRRRYQDNQTRERLQNYIELEYGSINL